MRKLFLLPLAAVALLAGCDNKPEAIRSNVELGTEMSGTVGPSTTTGANSGTTNDAPADGGGGPGPAAPVAPPAAID